MSVNSHSINYNLGQVWEGKCLRVGIRVLHPDVTLVDAPNFKKSDCTTKIVKTHLGKSMDNPEIFSKANNLPYN